MYKRGSIRCEKDIDGIRYGEARLCYLEYFEDFSYQTCVPMSYRVIIPLLTTKLRPLCGLEESAQGVL